MQINLTPSELQARLIKYSENFSPDRVFVVKIINKSQSVTIMGTATQ